MSKTIFVSIGNQKGGVGKTTTTANVASYINANTDYKVCIVDIDPQNSVKRVREKELAELGKGTGANPRLKKGVMNMMKNNPEKDFFPIIYYDVIPPVTATREEADAAVKEVIEKIKAIRDQDYDIVFFDFPGFTAHPAFIQCISLMDFVIVPFYPDDNTELSTVDFVSYVKEGMKEGFSNVKDIAIFMWRFSPAKLVEKWLTVSIRLMGLLQVVQFNNKVYDAVELQEYSTLYSVDMKDSKSLKPFVEEVLEFIKIAKPQ